MHSPDNPGENNAADRRSVLKLLGLGAATGGSALAAGAEATPAAAQQADDKTGSHYRETEHVKTYYDLAKF